MFVLQLIAGIFVVAERENRPAVFQVTVIAFFLFIPKDLELVSMWIVVTAAALLKVIHFSDHRSVAARASYALMLPF